jgi:phosphoribosylformylglycinamidine synthase II
MIYRVEVSPKTAFHDARGESILRQVDALDVVGIQSISVTDLYFLQGDLDDGSVQRLVDTLLYDPIVEDADWYPFSAVKEDGPASRTWTMEVTLLPGVTDSAAESLLEGARTIGVAGLECVATGQSYTFLGDVRDKDVHRIADHLLVNEVIQTYTVNQPVTPPFMPLSSQTPFETQGNDVVEVIPLSGADSARLEAISRERRLSLDLPEMHAIQAYYRQQGREPTDIELEMLAQTWSEHCVHKTFKALITYEELGPDGSSLQQRIDSLFKTCIRAATEKVNKPWVRSAFVDNAGIVTFDDRFDLAFKVETHNHPSALEPFGGANTGVGGVVRDVIGVSARPIANTDVLCFGPQDMSFTALPSGVLHPRRIADGVTAGIEDYGNKMGIPTVNGAILYDPGYTANPLVFCGCLGILPRDAHPSTPQAGDLVVVMGGRTGRDGLRGATFSSMEMTHKTSTVAGSAVQIGHPIHEKQVLEAVLVARDEGLYTALTDCGAGGLSSAVGEMGSDLGTEIHLERVPLKYPGLRPWEIWLSEAQERMVLAIPPANWLRLQEICQGLDVEVTTLGAFTGDGQLTLYYGQRVVGQLSTQFLHHGLPRRHLRAVWMPPTFSEPEWSCPLDLTTELLALLAIPDTRSKEDVVRRYDHEVQGGTLVKPLVGQASNGPSDAAVLAPLDPWRESEGATSGTRGVALAVGINPAYGFIDPYAMAWAAVDEAIRNCVAVGADPDQISLLDNFCWGNPNLPDRLGGLVRCAQGCHDAAVAYGAPFISGKDSLNNEYTGAEGHKHAIPGTLLISALGIVPDIAYTVTAGLKAPGNWLYVLGMTADELGGSTYHRRHRIVGADVPQPPTRSLELFQALHRAMAHGLVQACHDCSEGGLAVAAAEMALAGGLGLDLNLADVPRIPGLDRDDVLAFSESLGRLVVEVAPDDVPKFEADLLGLPMARVGHVRNDDQVQITGLDGRLVIKIDLGAVEQAWRGHLSGASFYTRDNLD